MLGFAGGFLILALGIRLTPLVSSFFPTTEVIGLVGNYSPTTLPLAIQNLLSRGLTRINQKGEALPSLTTSWEVKEGGKVYVFRLREDIIWHDGQKFTASDVNYNLKDVQIRPLDEFTLEMELKEPFSPLPVLLSQPLFKKGLVGTGPYQVNQLKLNVDRVELISLTPVEEKSLPELIFKFYPTESAAVTAFKLGEIDVLRNLTDSYNFSSWPKVKIKKTIKDNQLILIFYNLDASILQEKSVRQALNFALPELKQEKALGPISFSSWAFSEEVKTYPSDPKRAKKMIEEAGLATQSAQLKLSTFPSFLSLAQKIANAWEKLGIKVSVQVENTIPSDFEALLTIQEIPPDPDQYPLWHSTQQRTNLSRLKNPKIDKLLEDGRKTYRQEDRKPIYVDFQKYLTDEAPAAFLYYPTVYTISRR